MTLFSKDWQALCRRRHSIWNIKVHVICLDDVRVVHICSIRAHILVKRVVFFMALTGYSKRSVPSMYNK